jgi:hypothetical protein
MKKLAFTSAKLEALGASGEYFNLHLFNNDKRVYSVTLTPELKTAWLAKHSEKTTVNA